MTTNADIVRLEESLSVDDLVRIVQARQEPEAVLEALREVSLRKGPRRLEVFQGVLEDPQQDPRAKGTVITELGKEYVPENQTLLLQHLDARNSRLFAKAAQSLGQIGDEQALAHLEGLDTPADRRAARALGFAQSLISYRLRLDRHKIKAPQKRSLVKVRAGVPFTAAAAAEPALVQAAIRDAGSSLPAVPLAEDGAVQITCGDNELLLVFTAEFREPGALATLRDHNGLPLVLLKKGHCPEKYYLDEYFFTQAAHYRDQVDLLGLRSSGDLVFAGKITTTEEGTTFSVGALDSRYVAAMEIEGHWDPDTRTIVLTKTMAGTTVAARKKPALAPARAALNLG